jgi:GntR family transcriptional regulator
MTLKHIEKLNFDPNLPIYLQIMNFVKKLIVRGTLKPGEKVPSVRDMAVHLGVNPNTVQKAYEELESEGVIFTRRGQGNFVNESQEIVNQLKDKMVREIVERQKREFRELGVNIFEIIEYLKDNNDESNN